MFTNDFYKIYFVKLLILRNLYDYNVSETILISIYDVIFHNGSMEDFMDSDKVTIYDVAKAAGVSPATVSRVINHPSIVSPAIKQQVLEAMDKCGFTPAKSRQEKYVKSGAILLIVPETEGHFTHKIIENIGNYARLDNRDIFVLTTPVNSNPLLIMKEAISAVRPIGIISISPPDSITTEMLPTSIPIVLCCDVPDNAPLTTVDLNIDAIMSTGVHHLLNRGAKNIYFIGRPSGSPFSHKKYESVEKVLKENQKYCSYNLFLPRDNSNKAMEDTVVEIMQRKFPPDGVFAADDAAALTFMNMILSAGFSVPEDIMVLGIGNYGVSKFSTPTLSTIHTPIDELAYLVYHQLSMIIKNPDTPVRHLTVDSHVIERESTSTEIVGPKDASDIPNNTGNTLKYIISAFQRKKPDKEPEKKTEKKYKDRQ